MIYSDEKREVCPFCGGELYKDKYKDFHQCNTCMTEIHEGICEKTKKAFFYTDNSQLKTHSIQKADFKDEDYWFYEKQVESLMYFRNITKINHKGDIVCPFCHEVH
jgi:ribosomal protein L37AE/L43A